MKRDLIAVWLCTCLLFTACGNYQLGNPRSSLPERIHIAPVTNRAEVPQVRAMLTNSLRETFVRSGTWQLRDLGDSDAVVHVTLVSFDRETAATSSIDTGRGISFETRLSAEVLVLDAQTGAPLMAPFTVTSSAVSLANPSLPDSEYQSLPALCADLATQIYDRMAYTW